MNQAIIGLTLTYVALAALLLGIFMLARVPAWLKSCCLLMISGFYYLTWYSYAGLLGWPTRQALPEHFQLLASSITEPDQSHGEAGHIHLWLNAFEDNRPVAEPRAYVIPYDLKIHAALDEALSKQRQGKIQLGRRVIVSNDESHPTDTSRLGQKREGIEFSDLPEQELPEK